MIYALTDFGSTFTKIVIVDGSTGALLATSQHPTTVETDVFEGFQEASRTALAAAGLRRVDRVLAASSAGGGLRMAAVGLVDDLTAAAAKRAALSAGAKVQSVWSGRLGDWEVTQIRDAAPDVILFAGGTDGGDRERVLQNAEAVSRADSGADIVVACNRQVAPEVVNVFRESGHHVLQADNVLPRIDVENAEPAREAIRDLFIDRVVRAKGLSVTSEFFDAVLMPTPAAVLACAELIADPPTGEAGSGSAVIVDVGGATTDVHSVLPVTAPGRRIKRAGPPPARAARTVEGDLGVRWNADTVYEQDERWITSTLGLPAEDIRRSIIRRRMEPSFIPDDEAELRLDRALAISCIASALERHVGRLSTHYVPGEGADVRLRGRDLRDVSVILVTGGSIVRDPAAGAALVDTALGRLDATRPVPTAAALVIDRQYVIAAAGLLSVHDPHAALRLMAAEIPGLAEVLQHRLPGFAHAPTS